MTPPPTLTWLIQAAGASHLALALAHVVLWRAFDWSGELHRLTPLSARVFVVHLAYVVFVLFALGWLGLARPQLLTGPGELARLLLCAILMFWSSRLIVQPLVFDPVLLRGSRLRPWVRSAAALLFASYVAIYAWALQWQISEGLP